MIAYLVMALPKSFSTDLSRVGSSPLTVVAVHDLNLVASTKMMELLDRVEAACDDRVLFLVADVNNRTGRAFADTHGAQPATLLLFDSDERKIDTIMGTLDEAAVMDRIDRALQNE